MSNVIEALLKDNEDLKAEVASLSESLGEFSERIGEAQWTRLGTSANGEWTLGDLQRVAEPLTEMVHSNVLLQRAVELRHAYAYSDGVKMRNTHRATKAIDSERNQQAFFSTQAALTRMSERAATGNLFYLVNRSSKQVIHMPLSQVTRIVTDSMDPSVLLFVERRWLDGKGKVKRKWFRTTLATERMKLPGGVKGDIEPKWVVVHRAYNRMTGSALGIPDAMAAMKWAEAYSEYLTNQSRLVRAYSRIAGIVQRRALNTGKDVGAQIKRVQDENTYGSTVVGDFKHLPATGSQVSFDNGRPMAALVAAGLGVGVDALLSGTDKATKSVSDMLDLATNAVMKVLQRDEEDLIEAILRLIGAPNAEVDFPTMDNDPLYRRLHSVAQGTAQGLLWREEARDVILDWFNVPNPKKGLPEPDGFNSWSDPTNPSTPPVDPTPRQGHSGVAGSGVGSNNDARDNNEYDQ